MTFDVLAPRALDYLPCRYGASRLLFRGPRRDLIRPYVAFLGSTETYGKFIESPFPALVEDEIGIPCVNFGQINAGLDVFAQDPFVIEAAQKARFNVVQIMGAQNMTNRFYTVHPRRNDRFVSSSDLLKTLYKEVDFSEFHFTKHLLNRLYGLSTERFEMLRVELQAAWTARMRAMLKRLGGQTVLLWFSERAPETQQDSTEGGNWCDPLFVTRDMIEVIRSEAAAVIEVVPSKAASKAGTQGMIYGEMEKHAAENILGVGAHEEAVLALSKALNNLMK